MAVNSRSHCLDDSKLNAAFDDSYEFSTIFAAEFNSSDLSDRVLRFQFIEDDGISETKSDETYESHIIERERGNEITGPTLRPKRKARTFEKEVYQYFTVTTKSDGRKNAREDLEKDDNEPRNKKQRQGSNETVDENRNKTAAERSHGGLESASKQRLDKTRNKQKSSASKLFVHSQWLAVQSPYFKALFYSGMKETFSKEVVMKIYQHELQEHLTLIEVMYRRDVLDGKDYDLVVKVLILAHKYDVRHVIKKCKYVLLSTTPSLDMCEFVLGETSHLDDMAEIYDMLEKFLVEEFTPIDKTWTMDKFTELSEAALKLLLRSDSLATRSENTIFIALMKWVQWNIGRSAGERRGLLQLVRFEFMSVDFLYDVVQHHFMAKKMSDFNKYLQKGLAYHGFSQIRRDQLDPKPKQRPALPKDNKPTFSWVIDDELQKKLTDSPGVPVYSDRFWYQGYEMRLQLSYDEDSSKCSFYFSVLNIRGKACLNLSYGAKSILFVSRVVTLAEKLYKSCGTRWGFGNIERKQVEMGKSFTIDVWVVIVK